MCLVQIYLSLNKYTRPLVQYKSSVCFTMCSFHGCVFYFFSPVKMTSVVSGTKMSTRTWPRNVWLRSETKRGEMVREPQV